MIRPVPFKVDGRPLELRALNGAAAYEIAASGNWLKLVPGACDDDGRDWLWDRFDDARDPLTLRSMWRIAHGLAPHVYGVEWWSAVRLAGTRELSWMSFESWAVRSAFDPDAPRVTARRLTAALMTWLASTCEKDVEWQRMQMEVMQPPPAAIWLPADDDEASGMDISTFQANAPHWALTGGKKETPGQEAPEGKEDRDQDQEDETFSDQAEESEPAPSLPWAGQPVMSMSDFTSQAKAWAQSRRTGNEEAGAGAPPVQESG